MATQSPAPARGPAAIDHSLTIYGGQEQFATIGEILAHARKTSPPDVWNYIEVGTSAEDGLAANRAAFTRWNFSPRMLAGISRPDFSASLLMAEMETVLGRLGCDSVAQLDKACLMAAPA